MRNKIFKSVILLSFLALNFSCSKEYYDTKLAGEEFLAANKKNNPEVLEFSPSGIQYKVLFNNSYGIYPQFGEASEIYVDVKYSVKFIDGTVYKSWNEIPLTFVVSGDNEAMWSVVIPKMRVGSKWRVWAPYAYAFGANGSGETSAGSYAVDPYTVLEYEIELLDAYIP